MFLGRVYKARTPHAMPSAEDFDLSVRPQLVTLIRWIWNAMGEIKDIHNVTPEYAERADLQQYGLRRAVSVARGAAHT